MGSRNLTTHEGLSANFVPLAGNADTADWKITTFAKTPVMSTYLVAFANGHLDYLETKVSMPLSGRTVPLRIYGARSRRFFIIS